ncbi:MAG: exodeoxyribonuclease VII small subunit [Akkermansiaceae bacterium]|nr:exodeoxyribonuclease VII small subunit [Akkermansiaceae bacterium]
MAAKKKPKASADQDAPDFEQALEELEGLVEAMENEELPLEQLVANYEKGSKLLTHCQSVLESARERIELITLDNSPDSGLEQDPTASDAKPGQGAKPDKTQPSKAPQEDDDIRLL